MSTGNLLNESFQNSQIISREEVSAVLEVLPADARVLVCGHTRPDGDSVGSVLALTRALEMRQIDVTPLLADNASSPAPYSWMPGYENFATPESLEGLSADLFIALDTPDFKRLNHAGELLLAAKQSIIIDHHPPLPESYADVRYTQQEAAATGQLVWTLLGEMGWARDVDVATCCYVSTLSDTGGFQFSNTTKEAFSDVIEMIEAGVQPAKVARQLYSQKPLAALHLEGRILSRAKLFNGGAVVRSYLSDADLQELGVLVDYTENLIDLIRSARDTDVAIFITQSSKGPRLSLRSDGDFDVSEVARRFGGGGHRAAAGITWPDKTATLEIIMDQLLPLLPQRAVETGSETDFANQEYSHDWKIV